MSTPVPPEPSADRPGEPSLPSYPGGGTPPQPGAYGAGGSPLPASPYGPVYAQFPKNNLAVWSLVLGLVGLFLSCGPFTAIPAIVVGQNAKRAVAAGEANNEGMATAGVVLGWVEIGLTVLALIWLFFLGGLAAILTLVNASTTS